MPAKKLYVIHATVRYVVKSLKTGQTETGQSRPTIAIEATSEDAALNKARKREMERISTDYWPCVSLSVIPELVNVRPIAKVEPGRAGNQAPAGQEG